MQYVGLHEQISRNNRYSALLLIAFPTLLLGMLYIIIRVVAAQSGDDYGYDNQLDPNQTFLAALPVVLIAVGIWFLVACGDILLLSGWRLEVNRWSERKIKEYTISLKISASNWALPHPASM